MRRDNSPRVRGKEQLARKKPGSRAARDRILIVSEGTKTEPNYFKELRSDYRIASMEVKSGGGGTGPVQVVRYAKELFRKDYKKAFESVYVVFDRDDHASYEDALSLAEELNGKLRNDENKCVNFFAVVSIPCFELWLLLHFEDVNNPVVRDDVFRRLKHHLPKYKKGSDAVYALTKVGQSDAISRAKELKEKAEQGARGDGPFTTVHELVSLLMTMGQSR